MYVYTVRIKKGNPYSKAICSNGNSKRQQKKNGLMGFHKTPYGRPFPTQFFAHRSTKCEIGKCLYFKNWHIYSAYKKKVIHIQRPIVLKSIDFKICMWQINEEQLILFPLVPFLHQVCHAWPSTLPLKMTMSWPTLCKFWQLDKSAIAKQCNGVAAEIVSSHARWMRWSFPFWKILNSKVLATSPCALEDLSGVFDQN